MKRMAVWLVSALGLGGLSTFSISSGLPGMAGENPPNSDGNSLDPGCRSR